jgi:hypothetical protein
MRRMREYTREHLKDMSGNGASSLKASTTRTCFESGNSLKFNRVHSGVTKRTIQTLKEAACSIRTSLGSQSAPGIRRHALLCVEVKQ